MASKSLGPFPKTLRWRDIIARAGAPSAVETSDRTLTYMLATYDVLTKDPEALKAITFLVALPVATRDQNPSKALAEQFGISVSEDPSAEELLSAFDAFLPGEHLAKLAVRSTLVERLEDRTQGAALFSADSWQVWRDCDARNFCDLARQFYTHLNEQYFMQALAQENLTTNREEVDRFAHEASLITRAFSARWFNACARYEVPEEGSIRWYLGHCLGKLDLELSREMSDWVEPTGNPWKRRRAQAAATLDL
ncbi:MAG: hypothetical protein QOJ65_906 [Fimbriimonadaceae bacterium]|jgi:hypothetical protein|nr:hypothetical protein [Fimbriimonadaceae bacterium]